MVALVVAQDNLMQEALRLANTIAEYNLPAVRSAKEAVNRAFESSLAEGVLHERRLFHAAFAPEGQRQGMKAFLEKRAPTFSRR
jgi:enoyl-CoA hydratase